MYILNVLKKTESENGRVYSWEKRSLAIPLEGSTIPIVEGMAWAGTEWECVKILSYTWKFTSWLNFVKILKSCHPENTQMRIKFENRLATVKLVTDYIYIE